MSEKKCKNCQERLLSDSAVLCDRCAKKDAQEVAAEQRTRVIESGIFFDQE